MNKKHSYLILSLCLCLTTIFFVGCDKDDDSIPPLSNAFSFRGQNYNTVGGYAQNSGNGKFELGFFTENLSFDIIKGNEQSNAIGSFALMFIAQSGNQLQNGTFDLESASANSLFLNFNFGTGTPGLRINPESGTITIGGSGNTRTVNYELTLEGG